MSKEAVLDLGKRVMLMCVAISTGKKEAEVNALSEALIDDAVGMMREAAEYVEGDKYSIEELVRALCQDDDLVTNALSIPANTSLMEHYVGNTEYSAVFAATTFMEYVAEQIDDDNDTTEPSLEVMTLVHIVLAVANEMEGESLLSLNPD